MMDFDFWFRLYRLIEMMDVSVIYWSRSDSEHVSQLTELSKLRWIKEGETWLLDCWLWEGRELFTLAVSKHGCMVHEDTGLLAHKRDVLFNLVQELYND